MTTEIKKDTDYKLGFLAEADMEAVLRIAEEQLGNGYLSSELLATYVGHEDRFCQVVWAGDSLAGFSLMELGDCAAIAARFKEEEAWFRAYFGAYRRIAYRSLTAVAAAFEGKGLGSILVAKGIAFLADKAELLVCDAWKSDTTHIGNILERNGYKAIRELPNYWAAESVASNYVCRVCGHPPCACVAVIYAKALGVANEYWWARPELGYKNNVLTMAGISLLDFVQTKQTPLYLYDVDRVLAKYELLCAALAEQGVPYNIYYAMKANRHPGILSHLRMRSNIGIDVCSPNELDRALQYGFGIQQISYTGTALADRELQSLGKYDALRINLDSLSSVRRFATFSAQRAVGIRINTGVGMAYNEHLEYAGQKLTKFGIYPSEWQALRLLIEEHNMCVDTVHCHAGSGFLTGQLAKLPEVLAVVDAFIALFPTVKTLNMGGGLGVPQAAGDPMLDLKKWAAIIGDYAKSKGLKLAFEPGDFLVKDAGILIAQVNTVEIKNEQLFVGIDAGMNVNNEYAYYNMNLELVPLKEAKQNDKLRTTVFGNINEPVDLFAEDKMLPLLAEGEYIALLNSGGYGASSASNHCMRGDFKEYIICKGKGQE